MGRNLPPGVSVNDLPGSGPEHPEPECFHCGGVPDSGALADGYPLCADHDTPENRERIDDWKQEQKRRAEAERRAHEHQREAEKLRDGSREPDGTPEVFLNDDGEPRGGEGE